jgi:hypothetical protein
MDSKPYIDNIKKEYVLRSFGENIDPKELKWHRDLFDRKIEVLEQTNWLLQLENQLPEKISTNFIPKGVWHRLIKGSGELKIKIYEI